MRNLYQTIRQMVRALKDEHPKWRLTLVVGGDDHLQEEMIESANELYKDPWYDEAVIVEEMPNGEERQYELTILRDGTDSCFDRCQIYLALGHSVELTSIDLRTFYNLHADLGDCVHLVLERVQSSFGSPTIEIAGVQTTIPLTFPDPKILEAAMGNLATTGGVIVVRFTDEAEAHDHWECDFTHDDED